MKQSSNLGLALYDKTDLMNITGLENSLNHNMELIDSEISQLSQNKVDVVTEAKTYYVSATGNDNNTGLTTSDPLRTIAKALSLIPRNVDKYGAEIWLLSDIEEDVDFIGFSGTNISLRGNSKTDRATITGNITYFGNTIAYQVYVNVIGRVTSSYHAMVNLLLCNITSSDSYAINAEYGGKCIARECNITALGTGHYVGVVHAQYGATTHVAECTISPVTSGTGIGFTANYSAIAYSGNNTINTATQSSSYCGFVNIV